ncbi:MAG: histidine kinase [Gammaproteobacteria bacterium]|nr:histidine kinase [Gammaproteobacteria bacterium]
MTEHQQSHVETLPTRENTWVPLAVFFSYRLGISALLSILFFADLGPKFLGQHAPELYAFTAIGYLALVISSGPLLFLKRPAVSTQASIMVVVDIAAITLMLPTCGGVQSGLGALMALSIAAGSMFISGPTALLMASIATLSIIVQQVFTNLTLGSAYSAYPQAGLLGTSFFAIAVLAHVLSRRVSRSERLVTQQELDLANLAQLNEYIIQHMQTGILVVDHDHKIHLMNESAWFLLGMPEAREGSPLAHASSLLAEKIAPQDGNDDTQPLTVKPTPGGRELQIGFSHLGKAGRGGTVIFLEDSASVTQRAQQIKLASLGRLTASIAHEIRNPLGAISHAGQLLRESTNLSQQENRLVDIIHGNSDRVNQIIENVLQLSRRNQPHSQPIELQSWLLELTKDFCLTGNLSPSQLSTLVEPASTRVYADLSQLQQIIVNLCENSVRHFHRDPSKLHIQINGGTRRDLGGPYLEVIDNGPGISTDSLKQVYEPFFTTGNAGTGLGLYIAKELSESNRLNLEHVTRPDGGCCFRIIFPAWQAGS